MKPDKQNDPIISHVDEISEILTAHNSGTKKVLLNNEQSGNAITQIAQGKLGPGERVELHAHKTMTEYFYFTEGFGQYLIDGKTYELSKGSFVSIPEKTEHALINTGELPLVFFYFGIAND